MKFTPRPSLRGTVKKRVKKKAPAAPAVPKSVSFELLLDLIKEHVEVSIAESWKGGGDPDDMPVLEKELELSGLRLATHIERMRRYYEGEAQS